MLVYIKYKSFFELNCGTFALLNFFNGECQMVLAYRPQNTLCSKVAKSELRNAVDSPSLQTGIQLSDRIKDIEVLPCELADHLM